MFRSSHASRPLVLGALVFGVVMSSRVQAGEGRFLRRIPARAPVIRRVPSPSGAVEPLGTFAATPYLMVRGNAPAGGGYSPLGEYGDTTLALYGPLSALRTTSAPIQTYTRGYDGRTIVAPGTAFSTPNLPALSPVVYPTQATNYFGFRQSGSPPWWASGINWIDQN
ncbi:MAG: hypothetical protein NVSMB9_10940 [Isosphaeraceae bacterium]